MAEGAKREYSALFLIGAKLMGNFRGTIIAAQARLKALERTAKLVGTALKGLAIGVGGLLASAAGIAGLAGLTMLKKLFEGATEQAIEARQRTRELQVALMQNDAVRKRGSDYAQYQLTLIEKQVDALKSQGVVSQDMYQIMGKTLAQFGVPTQQLMDALGPMADVLANLKGVKATEQDSLELATAIGRAINTGQMRGLRTWIKSLTASNQKEFKALKTRQEQYEYIMRLLRQYRGENERLGNTEEGRMVKLQNRMQEMREEIGMKLLPIQARMAEMWLKVLPKIEPAILAGLDALAKGIENVSNTLSVYFMPQLVEAQMRAGTLTKEMEKQNAAANTNKLWWKKFWIDLDAGFNAIKETWAWMDAAFTKFDKDLETAFKNFDWTFGFAKQWRDAVNQFHTWWATMPKWMGGGGGGPAGAGGGGGGGGAAVAPAAGAAAGVPGMGGQAIPGQGGMPVSVRSYGGPQEPGQKIGSYNNRLGLGDVAISPNLIPTLGAPGPNNYVTLDGKRYHVADTSWYTPGHPTSNMVEIWGYGNDIARKGMVAASNAMGGIVGSRMLSWLGERGPEAVIPLSGGRRAQGLLDYASRAIMGRPLFGGGMGETSVSFAPNIVIHGNASEAEQRAMDSRLRDLARDFIDQFRRAQSQQRRLSYESGYA